MDMEHWWNYDCQRHIELIGETHVSMPRFALQIPHRYPWGRNRPTGVRMPAPNRLSNGNYIVSMPNSAPSNEAVQESDNVGPHI